MAKITLTVTAVTENARSDIKKLQEYAVNVFSNPIQIKFESGALESIKNQISAITKTPANIQIDTSSVQAASGEITKYSETIVQGAQASKKSITEMRIGVGEYVKTIKDASETGSQVTKQHIINYDEQRKAAEKAAREQERSAQAAQKAREKELDALVKAARAAEDAADRKAKAAEMAAKREAEATGRANQRAAASISTLDKQYSDLIRQINTLKSQYPEGTFDAIEREAREAQGAVRGLDTNASDLAAQVQALQQRLNGLKAGFSEARTETQKLDKVTESLWMNLQKFARWWLVGGIVTTITRSLREAIDTMKEVDQQLTNIQKVSDITASELRRIGDSAYDVASKYGVAADEYLQAVYTFQKAGLSDNSEAMAELATKTMLVGDTTADVATQFLIATNAAWKLGGNIETLSRIVDEADKLNNNYAVSLSDIAEGLPIVAATAAQVGMSAEQTMAAISTIVASTGQSATKAATALRAILMNLIGETGEFEEGIVVTEETMKTLNVVLNQYAADALKAAEASGTIVDPMEALAAVAQAVTEGFLSEAEAFELMSGLGGKLRTTQLVALVNNQEMYNNMLRDTADAAGTADKEIGVMLESWNSKTQILKNSWTKFVSNLLDTKAFKSLIEVLTSVVKILDTDFGRAVVSIGAMTAAFALLRAGYLKAAEALKSGGLISGITALITAIQSGSTAVEIFTAVWNSSPLVIVTIIAAAVYGLAAAIDALTTSTSEYSDSLTSANDAAKDAIQNVESITSKLKENLAVLSSLNEAESDDSYKIRLMAENEQLRQQLELNLQIAADKKRAAADAAVGALTNPTWNGIVGYSFDRNDFTGWSTITQFVKDWSFYRPEDRTDYQNEKIIEYVNLIQDSISAIDAYQEAGGKLTEQMKAARMEGVRALELYGIYAERFSGIDLSAQFDKINLIEKESEVLNKIDLTLSAALKSSNEDFEGLYEKLTPLGQAYKEIIEQGGIAKSTWDSLGKDVHEALTGGVTSYSNGKILVEQETLEKYIDSIITASGYTDALSKSMNGMVVSTDNATRSLAEAEAESTKEEQIQQKIKAALDAVGSAREKAIKGGLDDYDALNEKLNPLETALKEVSESGGMTEKSMRSLVEAFPELEDDLDYSNGLFTISTDKLIKLIQKYTDWDGTIEELLTESVDPLTKALKTQIDVYNSLKDSLLPVKKALEELNNTGVISEATMQALIAAHPELVKAVQVTADGFVIEREALENLINAQIAERELIYNSARNAALEMLSAEGIKTDAVNQTTDAILKQLKALQNLYAAKGIEAIMNGEDPAQYVALSQQAGDAWVALSDADSEYNGFKPFIPNYAGGGTGGGKAGAGSSSSAPKDPELERLKDAVALEKQRLSFLETSNASEEEQIAKMREVQEALHAQADYMRSIGASEKDVLALSTEWWQYQNKIDKLLEDAAKKAQEAAEAEAKALREGIAATLEDIGEELEKQAELATSPLQEELDALKAAHDLRKEDTEEAEKLLAVEKASIALENAERERNVRVYNAKTGQWEWVSNAQTVASAREGLDSAQKALADFYAENAYNARVKELEDQINETKEAFVTLTNAINDAAKAVRDGSMTGDEAYAGIGAAINSDDIRARTGMAGAMIGIMKANSAAWHGAGADERAELEAQNLAIGTSLGWHRGADGVWYDAVGSRAYDRWTDADVVSPFGFGSAVSGTGYDAMLRSMGIVTSAGRAGGGYAGGSGSTSIGEQHNGDVYQIGGVTLTEGQARGMTVFDLVQMAGGLALHGG